MTSAEELRQRARVLRDVAHEIAWDHQVQRRQLLHVADELDDEALMLRYDEPGHARTLTRIARELRSIAANLNPEARSAHA